MHPAAIPIDELLRDCEIVATRRGGPGGQHRNKVDTAVVVRHRPTGMIGQASERRSQAENRRVAVRRLRLALAVAVREPAGVAPSPGWAARVVDRRFVVADEHDDFPSVVAEAIDQLAAAEWRIASAAAMLRISSSQLAGLLRRCPAAWQAVNAARIAAGLPPLG